MGKLSKNQDGFTLVEALLIILILVIIGAVGYMVYHNNHTASSTNTADKTTSTSNSSKETSTAAANTYSGWKTDTSAISGVNFKYPSTWTVSVPSQATCTGEVSVTITPSGSEISQALTAKQYYINIEKYGTESSSCAPDGTDYSTLSFSSITSSDQVQSGIFGQDWLTFFSGGNNPFYPSEPDTAILTASSYSGQSAFTDSGTVQVNGSTYQVGIVTSTASGGQENTPVSVSVSSFKKTQLYKDTLNALSSFTAN